MLALGVVSYSQTAEARGDYLLAVSDTVGEELGQPACELPGMTCGLCHEPSEGDRLENVVVGFPEIVPETRNGPFFDSLTMSAGWDPLPGNMNKEANLAALLDTVLPTMLNDAIDSDMDTVPDLVELQLGYNPLLAYDADDPTRSQLCDGAQPFPDEGGDGDGDPTTGDGDGDPTTGDGDGDGDDDPTTGDGDGDPTTGDGDGDPASGDGDGDGSEPTDTAGEGTSETGVDDVGGDEEGGCSCSSNGGSEGPLGLLTLVVLGLGLRSRRSELT